MRPEYEKIKLALSLAQNRTGDSRTIHTSALVELSKTVRQLLTLEHEAKEAQHRFDTGEIDFETAMSLRGRAVSMRLILADVVGHEWPPED